MNDKLQQSSEEITRKLQDLAANYFKSLPGKINSIEQGWQTLLQTWSNEGLHDYHREVHSLCGSAGTYGYMDISQHARQLEICLKNLTGCEPDLSVKEHISSLIEQLHLSFVDITQPEASEPNRGQPDFSQPVYILDADKQSGADLVASLVYAGFNVQEVESMRHLEQAVMQKNAFAIILDTEFLNGEGLEQLQRIKKLQSNPCHIFCLVQSNDLQPRLQAIRAQCHSFFQKPVDLLQITMALNQNKPVETQQAYRIMIVDDTESLADYYALILTQAGFITHVVTNPLLTLSELDSFYPDLVLMDIYMPECTGLELAAVLRQEPRHMKIPIIFLSTEDDRRKQLSAMSFGGDDFLTKPVLPQHLVSAVRSRVKRADTLNYFMTSDSLTGLLNHSSVLARLEMEIAFAKQNKTPLSVAMIDIDHFKKVNDTWGHPAGDMVLQKLATLFLARLRRQDVVGRYGGEEFALVLPGATVEQAVKICDELRQQFTLSPFHSGADTFYLSFSAGCSSLDECSGAGNLIALADKALYQAKQQGRNRVCSYEGSSLPSSPVSV